MIRLITACLIALLTAETARAGLITYSDRASFDSAAGSLAGFESFDTFFVGSPRTFPGFTASTASGSLLTTFVYGVTDGNFALSVPDKGDLLTFTFDSPINAFGIDVTVVPSGRVTVGGDIAASFAANSTPTFFGVINDTGTFDTVTFTSTGTGPEAEFDALSFGTAAFVPEPSSLALLGVGVIGLISCRNRSRKNTMSTA